MHLLYLGVMKNLFDKLLTLKKHPARLKSCFVNKLKVLMKSISSDIPCEFERKIYDLDQIFKRKAMQFRFLLYIGAIAFKNVLCKNKY